MNQITHPFSLIAIKDTFLPFPNRFLVYWDVRWECYLFPNFKTQDENEQNIKARLSNQIKIDSNEMQLEQKKRVVYQKYSVSDEVNKCYEHTLYACELTQFTETLMQDQFEIDGRKYRWMTIDEMEQDPEIRTKNLDVVQLVKENIV